MPFSRLLLPMSIKRNSQCFHFKNVEIHKEEENLLGIGSYGTVYRAKCDQLPCAAKILHPALFQSNDPGARKILQRFEQECSFMNEIRHPNIVLYLGVCRDIDSNLPVLLMELLDESLTKLLKCSKSPLLFHIQLDICYDVALALSYLHSNGLIHRDLSSNNVLVAGHRAKVSDFGMSKLMSNTHLDIQSTGTLCPGTEVYMSPEAMKEPPAYTEKLDCFSFGVLLIQVLTGLFPNPAPRFREITFPSSPTGTISMPVLETERRNNHIGLIDSANPMLFIAIRCLDYNPDERPTSTELCEFLSAIQTTSEYTNSKGNLSCTGYNLDPVTKLQRENSSLKMDLSNTKEQLVSKERLLLEKENMIQEKNRELEMFQEQVQVQLGDLKESLTRKELELNNKLGQGRQMDKDQQQSDLSTVLSDQSKDFPSETERIISQQKADIADLQQRLIESERDLQSVRQMLVKRETELIDFRQRGGQASPQLPRHIKRISEAEATGSGTSTKSSEECAQVQVTSGTNGKAICRMARGSTAVNGSKLYFRPAGGSEVYVYDTQRRHWSELPPCPLSGFILVTVSGFVTAIGVDESDKRKVNILLSYLPESKGESESEKCSKWSEQFPAMLTKRYNPAAVCTEQILVVAGGNKESGDKSNIVEVMDIANQKWFLTSELPIPISQASASVYKNNVYLIGGVDDNRKWVNLVLTCAIDELCKYIPKKTRKSKGNRHFSHSRSRPKSVSLEWHLIANLPVGRATCSCLGGMLLAIGGVSLSSQTTSHIHMYNEDGDCWEMVGHMNTARSQCLVASQENKAVVVGGWVDSTSMTDGIEILECTMLR